ncbi:MAG TPA: tetratricopeptide repeat protein [Thermoanaerobaculia bacterium]|nr:tetratricopeptide repeat protein [Thermoanaerobaculia bacterium]
MPDSNGRGGFLSSFRRHHISDAMAKGFFENTLRADGKMFVVRHLLGRCGRCSERMLRVGVEVGVLAPSDRDDFRILNLQSPEIGTRRILGIAQWAILQGVPDRRIPFLDEHPEFHHLGLYERLTEVSRLEARRQPRKAMEAANLAFAVARHLKMPEDLRNDYMATASALLGNASRLAADFAGAEMALNAAWELREDGTADPLVDALIYRYEGALYAELGRYDEAEHARNNALIEYTHAGDEHLQGRTLLSLAATASYHDPAKAIGYLGRASALYDPSIEPFLDWCARHIEIWSLNEMGRPEAALQLLEDSRELYNQFGYPDLWVRLRGYWIEARIAFNLGKVAEAEKILAMLFRDLDEEGNHPVELTLIAVDLLQAISAQEGRQDDILAFSEMLLPLLRNLGLHDQGRAVMLLLRNRLLQGVIDNVRWKTLKTYFRVNWYSPLPVEPKVG